VFKNIRILVVTLFLSLSVFVVPAPAGAAPIHHHPVVIHQVVHKPVVASKPLVSPLQKIQWSWVGFCETHDDWTMEGSLYAGALGITRTNWIAYGGRRFAYDAAHATPSEQIYIATVINKGYPVPDQPTGIYCDPRGW
jgi:hypothetical protein